MEPTIPDDMDAFCDTLDRVASEEFWMHTLTNRRNVEPLLDFDVTDIFMDGLQKLKNLKCIQSRPMPRQRVLTYLDPPIPVELLQTHWRRANADEEDSGAPLINLCTNGGLAFSLLGLLTSPFSLPENLELRWQDEPPGMNFTKLPAGEVWRLPIKSLSLDFLSCNSSVEMGTFKAFIDMFPYVTALSLRIRRSLGSTDDNELQETLLRLSGTGKAPRTAWNQLHSLSLHGLSLVPDLLSTIVEVNAKTLRSLTLIDCQIQLCAVMNLATIPRLNLEKIVITESYADDDAKVFISSKQLCLYINNKRPFKARFKDRTNAPFVLLSPSQTQRAAFVECSHSQIYDSTWRDDDTANTLRGQEIDAPNSTILSHSPTAPSWGWERFFHDPAYPEGRVFYWRAPQDDLDAQPTTWWSFVSRDGKEAIGEEPLDWFEDWDINAGDEEAPTPFSGELMRWYKGMKEERRWLNTSTVGNLMGSHAREVLISHLPPKDAKPLSGHKWKQLALAYWLNDC
jgi:hypothetical protein